MNCQTFSTGLSSGEREGNQIGVTFSGIFNSGVVCQPAVEDEDGVRAWRDMGCDFVEMELHHLGVGIG